MKIACDDLGEIVFDPATHSSAYVLQFANGRRIYSLSSNPNALAGKRGHVTLDEFALHPDQRLLYRVAKPVTTWGGQLSIISTHRGIGTLFYQLVRDAQGANPMGWSLHEVPLQKAVDEGIVERINKKTRSNESRADFLKRIRDGCVDEEQWLQEYCCIPADENAAFFSYQLIDSCTDASLELFPSVDAFLTATSAPAGSPLPIGLGEGSGVRASASGSPRPIGLENGPGRGSRNGSGVRASASGSPRPIGLGEGPGVRALHQSSLYLGLDVARYHNLCVIDLGQKIDNIIFDRLRLEFHDTPLSAVEAKLYPLLALPQLKRACIDNSGMGIQFAERARERFGWKVEPVTLSGPKKEELAFALRHDFEDRRLRIPADEKLRADLRGLKKELTPSGKLTFIGDTDDSHCDRTWAKALRQHAARYRASAGAMLV